MLKNILAAFSAPEPSPFGTDDARLALAALMVRLARVDNDYATEEMATISAVLRSRFHLDEASANELRREAEELEKQAPDTVRFTRVVKDSVDYDDRIGVVESLWELVLADGHRDNEENSFLRLVANLLGVNDRDSALARQRVQSKV
ncbi:hypothetical protein GCM10008927_20840 [Amylibacter ulvae]|uniref:Co-chaperone DjlA N-terminal domain-containing protein n=1 Tax=Paramylibacter ulvae TaxID=1651968 RepID=A0ABQ3D7N2_9RHOB|nr:TerB family tellurite resistance protein [Amylibacter ulvae]GHA54853.1 hypothetical protein GCM10008927_20840 [Amylibacter ulvae]